MTTWKIDVAHTDILFSAKHMMVTTVRGKFGDVEGTLEVDEADPAASRGTITVGAGSLDTRTAQRDAHLRSPDFLDVERYPSITFTSTEVRPKGGDRYDVTGDLTIRDVTRPATFDVEVLGFYPSMQGGRRLGLSARTTLDRGDWGLGWNVALEAGGWLVGKQVHLEIDVALDEVPAEVTADPTSDPHELAAVS